MKSRFGISWLIALLILLAGTASAQLGTLLRTPFTTNTAPEVTNIIKSLSQNLGTLVVTNDAEIGGRISGNGALLSAINAPDSPHSTVLSVPTFDGTNSITHPNVLLSAQALGGYRYWLTYTPYPGADREWVSVAGSHDLQNWETPQGMSSNVLFAPGDLSGVGCANGWWADPEIIEHTNGSLVVFGLAQYWSGTPVDHYRERVCMRQSADGVTWSAITPCFSATNTSNIPLIAGPEAVIWTNGMLRLYYVDQSQALTNRLVYREATDWTLTNWSDQVLCQFRTWTNLTVGFNPWHGELRYSDDGTLHWLVSQYESAWHTVYYATSTDGTGTNFTWSSLGGVIAKSGNGFDVGGWYKPTGILKSNGKWDLIVGTFQPNIVIAEPWKLELFRDTTIPMPKSEMIYWQSNSWQAPIVPPASLLSTATGPTTWNGLANWFVGNRFSIFTPTPVRYANIYWSGNTGRVTATIFRLSNPKSAGSVQAWANSTDAAGTRFDFGPMTLPPGDYVLGFWSDNNGTSTYHATSAASSTNAMLSFAANSSVWPPAAWSAALGATQRYLQGVSLDGDYSQP